jgi:hypothetical protein
MLRRSSAAHFFMLSNNRASMRSRMLFFSLMNTGSRRSGWVWPNFQKRGRPSGC